MFRQQSSVWHGGYLWTQAYIKQPATCGKECRFEITDSTVDSSMSYTRKTTAKLQGLLVQLKVTKYFTCTVAGSLCTIRSHFKAIIEECNFFSLTWLSAIFIIVDILFKIDQISLLWCTISLLWPWTQQQSNLSWTSRYNRVSSLTWLDHFIYKLIVVKSQIDHEYYAWSKVGTRLATYMIIIIGCSYFLSLKRRGHLHQDGTTICF